MEHDRSRITTEAVNVEFDLGGMFARTRGGALTGHITVRVGNLSFPDSKWIDFFDIVGWWADTIRTSGTGILRFLDGPYEMQIDSADHDSDEATLTLTQRKMSGAFVTRSVQISRKQFRSALADACARLSRTLRMDGYADETKKFEQIALQLGAYAAR